MKPGHRGHTVPNLSATQIAMEFNTGRPMIGLARKYAVTRLAIEAMVREAARAAGRKES